MVHGKLYRSSQRVFLLISINILAAHCTYLWLMTAFVLRVTALEPLSRALQLRLCSGKINSNVAALRGTLLGYKSACAPNLCLRVTVKEVPLLGKHIPGPGSNIGSLRLCRECMMFWWDCSGYTEYVTLQHEVRFGVRI